MRVRGSIYRLPLCAALLASAMTGACSGTTGLLDAGTGTSGTGSERQQASSRKVERTVSYRPALGPPDAVNAVLSRQLNVAALEQGIALVVDPNVTADHTLRGYVSALRKGSQVSLSYVWDVVDARGQRVHRIAGEETIPGGTGEAWAAVTPDVARALALKTMSELGQWARSNPVTRPAAPDVAATSAATPALNASAGGAALVPVIQDAQ